MLRLRRQLPATPTAIVQLRRLATAYASEVCEAHDQLLADVALCVSEAATNVVQHAYNEHHRGAIELEVYETAAHLIVQITDIGAGTEDSLQPGTGLRIVSQLASAQITNSHTGTNLTISFPCASLA